MNTVLLISEIKDDELLIEKCVGKTNGILIGSTNISKIKKILATSVIDIVILSTSDYSFYTKLSDIINQHKIPTLTIISDSYDKHIVEKAIKTNTDFIVKPINQDELYYRLKGLLLRYANMQLDIKNWSHKFNLITDNLPIVIAQVNSDLKFILVNQAYANFHGKTKKKLKDKKLTEILSSDYCQDILPHIKKTLTGQITQYEHKWMIKNGKNRFFHTTLIPQIKNDKVDTFYILKYDITRLKKREHELEQHQIKLKKANNELIESNKSIIQINKELIVAKERAEKSDKLKSAFLANISHEIRTPMNAIMGFSQLLNMNNLNNEKKANFIELINIKCNYLLDIINDLIDISKLEVHEIRLFKNYMDITEMFDELKKHYSDQNIYEYPSTVKLRYKISLQTKQLSIYADATRLKQIIGNLIHNSMKFTKTGFVEYGCNMPNNDTIEFYVKDTGSGIPKEKQEFIFNYFRQGDDNYLDSGYSGTGIGLSIAKGLTTLMHGKIRIESTENVGSTFYVSIPYQQSN